MTLIVSAQEELDLTSKTLQKKAKKAEASMPVTVEIEKRCEQNDTNGIWNYWCFSSALDSCDSFFTIFRHSLYSNCSGGMLWQDVVQAAVDGMIKP